MNETLAGAEEVARHRNRKRYRARRFVLFQEPPSLMRGTRRSSGSRCSIPSKNPLEAPILERNPIPGGENSLGSVGSPRRFGIPRDPRERWMQDRMGDGPTDGNGFQSSAEIEATKAEIMIRNRQ